MAEARAEARDKGKTTKAKAGRPRPRPRAEARGQAWGLRSAAGLSISPVLLMRIIAQPSYELLIDWLQGVPQPISQALQGPETRGRRASGHTHTRTHTHTHRGLWPRHKGAACGTAAPWQASSPAPPGPLKAFSFSGQYIFFCRAGVEPGASVFSTLRHDRCAARGAHNPRPRRLTLFLNFSVKVFSRSPKSPPPQSLPNPPPASRPPPSRQEGAGSAGAGIDSGGPLPGAGGPSSSVGGNGWRGEIAAISRSRGFGSRGRGASPPRSGRRFGQAPAKLRRSSGTSSGEASPSAAATAIADEQAMSLPTGRPRRRQRRQRAGTRARPGP